MKAMIIMYGQILALPCVTTSRGEEDLAEV